jgi:hypothetical protein
LLPRLFNVNARLGVSTGAHRTPRCRNMRNGKGEGPCLAG